MLSKNLIKYIHSLELKKFRKREKVFVAEGPKVVGDLLKVVQPKKLIATKEWFKKNGDSDHEVEIVTNDELAKLSFLQHPQNVLAVFPIPRIKEKNDYSHLLKGKLTLALDSVQDPGNLGTIIRIADWFGIDTILCSNETADVYNPKVVQATMGSIARVQVIYVDLVTALTSVKDNIPIYGTFLNGDSIYDSNLSNEGIIVMGNEGNGISKKIVDLITNRILIPSYPKERETADSLNVAIATAITCAEFRRMV
ncbi:TrmH family RNA methyltransferase [Prevotella sp. OH937_COT-195]|uniref:TrmH family RNA methyltransferase n=1 Tax=Prevotella sp. OH937_COT-195 TaxID=2491051 RepID=UPI000F64E3EF|nr:RNA methyltransferase [Prevotella sp. OH937_COT-195]RRD00854.1 RNA methyltransferase [Prevotella sp. OH937_COT-195]